MTARRVVIAGGGVIGCSVAWYAARRGLEVTLVDRPQRGKATTASAGGLWARGEAVGLGCGVILYKKALAERGAAAVPPPQPLPRAFLDFALASNALFPELARELLAEAAIDIEFARTSLLFLLYDAGDVAYAETVCRPGSYGGDAVERLSPEDVARAEPAISSAIRGALRVRGDDQVNPYKLAQGLEAAARARGARFLSGVDVTGVHVENGRVRAVGTDAGEIPCDVLVNAAGAWAPEVARLAGVDHLPVRPVRGQIVCTEHLPPLLSACVSTTECYLLQKRHGEILIGSTTEEVGFAPGVPPQAMRTLAAGAVRAVPSLAHAGVKRVWSGFRPGTPDELPILGPVEGLAGYLNACGHFRTGIVTSPLTGLVIAELAAGGTPSVDVGPFLLARFRR